MDSAMTSSEKKNVTGAATESINRLSVNQVELCKNWLYNSFVHPFVHLDHPPFLFFGDS